MYIKLGLHKLCISSWVWEELFGLCFRQYLIALESTLRDSLNTEIGLNAVLGRKVTLHKCLVLNSLNLAAWEHSYLSMQIARRQKKWVFHFV